MTRISNSNIGWFLKKGPAYLHSMLTGEIEGESGRQLSRGTMIHEYLLQPEEFHKDYLVWDKSRPSSLQQEKFCQEFAQSVEIEPNRAAISAYRMSYKGLPKSDDLVLSKALKMAEEYSDYIEYLKSNDNRELISPYDARTLMEIAENIQRHKLASKLLKNEYIGQEDELRHEFHINWSMCGVQCKSLLDSCHFDFKNKICTLMDLKTTVNIGCFEESMNHYDYLRQLCFYEHALRWYIINVLKEEPNNDWTFKYYIIGIDTTGRNEIRVFEFTESQIHSRLDTIMDALEDIRWHQANNKWEHTVEYYIGDGAEKLNL
nr:MAG TPA: Exodeoxyribonuclease 8 [Caudoviricetes sp.]